jgi:hypothetical protein
MPSVFYNKIGQHYLIGKRIKLIHTDDPRTDLKIGDLGTVKDIKEFEHNNDTFVQIGVNWSRTKSKLSEKIETQFEIIKSNEASTNKPNDPMPRVRYNSPSL